MNRDILRDPRIAAAAVFVGLGGGLGVSVAGCGGGQSEQPATSPQVASDFELCPEHAFKAIEIPRDELGQASAITTAAAMACFILDQQSKPGRSVLASSAIDSSGNQTALLEVARTVKDPAHKTSGEYWMRVTTPSLEDLHAEAANPFKINKESLRSVSIAAKLGRKTIFAYNLAQMKDGWHLDASFNAEGYQYRFDEKIDDQNEREFGGVSLMAIQIACFADRNIPPTHFYPTFVQFSGINSNCLPRDHVGTPKTFLPVFEGHIIEPK